jgi:hypothetical protein
MSDTDRRGISQSGEVQKPRQHRGRQVTPPIAEQDDLPKDIMVAPPSQRAAPDDASPLEGTVAQASAEGATTADTAAEGPQPKIEALPHDEVAKEASAAVAQASTTPADVSSVAAEGSAAPTAGGTRDSLADSGIVGPIWMPDLSGAEAAREVSSKEARKLETTFPHPSLEPPPGDDDGRELSDEEEPRWRGSEAARASPPPGGRANNVLALVALVLSLLLPAGLYAYLAANGVFDRPEARLAKLETSVSALRAALPPKAEVSRADIDKLSTRLDDLEKKLAVEPSPQPSSSASAAGTGADAAEIEAASRDAKDALARAKAAEEATKSVEQLASRLASVEAKLAALEKRAATAEQASTPRDKERVNAVPILIMARTIAGDLANGTPYVGELDALARLGADPKLVEALRPFAEKGAPSPTALSAEFESELNKARDKIAESEPPRGFWDRLSGALSGLVRVRHIGADAPGTPGANVEAALARGDLSAARDAVNALPVFEKNATQGSSARIKALADGYDAARQISEEALETIRRSSAENGG